MDLQVVVWESMYWIDLAEDRGLVNAVIKIRVSCNERNFLTSQFISYPGLLLHAVMWRKCDHIICVY
jgi:ABC-type polysaccharide transport system permease subunit